MKFRGGFIQMGDSFVILFLVILMTTLYRTKLFDGGLLGTPYYAVYYGHCNIVA